ncbi:hypothetical protein GJAV_G00093820 [Gymnothorax javanicus]|nr:hypothetical protein GJAV_G00093820 [Gymnothorax javanicus]
MKCEPLFLAVLLLNLGSAVALEETKICYILDGILFVYGIILTILYCRMKMGSGKNASQPQNKPKEEGIYTGLTVPHPQDTYETIGKPRKGMV